MTDKELTIAHWVRMINWVKSIDLENSIVIMDNMFKSIGESWSGSHCSYCKKYMRGGCRGCPLAKKYGQCDDEDSSNINMWIKVNRSATWREWLKNAEMFLEQLKTL